MLISSIQSDSFFFISLEVLSSALPILTGRAFLWYLQCKYTVSIFSCSRFYSFDSLMFSSSSSSFFSSRGIFVDNNKRTSTTIFILLRSFSSLLQEAFLWQNYKILHFFLSYITYVTSVNYIQRVLCKTFMCLLYITKQYAPPTFFFLIYFYCRKVCVVYIFFLITFSSHHRLGLYLTTLPLYRYRLLSIYHLYAHCRPYLFKFR